MLGNRLRKRHDQLRKWAARAGIEAFRLYERDIPEFPATVDWYAGEVVAWLHPRTRDDTPELEEAHRARCVQEIREGLGIDEARLTINKSDTAWSVYAKCAVQLPIAGGVGASGEFSVVNGNIDLISVALASQTGINIPGTPLLINYIQGSIKNLTNLDRYPWLLAPGILIAVTTMAFNFLGDHLRDRLDPRAAGRL